MEKEITKIIKERISAIKNKNVDKATANYSEDVITFDVVGNLKFNGKGELKNRLKEWLSTLSEIIDYEISDVKINSSSEIAFCSSLNHINAKTFDGTALNMWWRETTCYVKTNKIWRITHAHSSVPFNAESGMASLGLKPNIKKIDKHQESTEKSSTELVKSLFQAFQNQDRESIENLLSSDFIFSSPNYKNLNKEQYFAICFPFSEKVKKFKLETILENGNEVFVIYKCSSTDQSDFVNTEYFTVEKGKIKSVIVFFGDK